MEFIQTELKEFEEIQGPSDRIEHQIRLQNPNLIKQKFRSQNPVMQQITDEEVDRILLEGVIQPSRSPCCSPILTTE